MTMGCSLSFSFRTTDLDPGTVGGMAHPLVSPDQLRVMTSGGLCWSFPCTCNGCAWENHGEEAFRGCALVAVPPGAMGALMRIFPGKWASRPFLRLGTAQYMMTCHARLGDGCGSMQTLVTQTVIG